MNEFSAGGVIVSGRNILLVKVKNLSGKIIWTFPKGHLEKGETNAAAALREVFEETGYRCEISRRLGATRYKFTFKKILIKKKVEWFLMKPLKRACRHDNEVLTVRWFEITKAAKTLKYETDLLLLAAASGSKRKKLEEKQYELRDGNRP